MTKYDRCVIFLLGINSYIINATNYIVGINGRMYFMKDTGVIRKIDELGRFTLPMELRRKLNIEIGDPLEVFVEGESIILKKYVESDIFTGKTDELIDYHGKKVSKQSIIELAKLAGFNISE